MYTALRLIASITLVADSMHTSVKTAKNQKTGRVSICIEAILFIWYATDFVFISHRILALLISILLLLLVGFRIIYFYKQRLIRAQEEETIRHMEMIMRRLDGGGFIIITKCNADVPADDNQCIDVDRFEVVDEDEK